MSVKTAEISFDRSKQKFVIDHTINGQPRQNSYPDTPFERQVILMGTPLSLIWGFEGMGDESQSAEVKAPETLALEKMAVLNLRELIQILRQAGIIRAHPNLIFEILKKYPVKIKYQHT